MQQGFSQVFCVRQFCVAVFSMLACLCFSDANAEMQARELRQFQLNAKLAGRTLACGDRAGHASMREASRRLAALLPEQPPVEQSMQAFDKRARLQRRFTDRASNKKRACERIADQVAENLRFTRLIAPQYPEPE